MQLKFCCSTFISILGTVIFNQQENPLQENPLNEYEMKKEAKKNTVGVVVGVERSSGR